MSITPKTPASSRPSSPTISEKRRAGFALTRWPPQPSAPSHAAPQARREPRLNLKPQDDILFVRRQTCQGCLGVAWGVYRLEPDGRTLFAKGVVPILACQAGDESICGVRMKGLDSGFLDQILGKGGTA